MALACIEDYEEKASTLLSENTTEYFCGGAEHGVTVKNNKTIFKRLRLRSKCLQDVSKVDMTTSLLGFNVAMPIGISPTAFHKFAHPDGEVATARAAQKADIIMTLSSFSNCSIGEVGAATPESIKWSQVYIFKDRYLTEWLVKAAEANGFKALVVTVDSAAYGMMHQRKRGINKLPLHLSPAFRREYTGPLPAQIDASLTWEDVKWLIGFSKLPVIAKGILRPDDAVKAVEAGCKAVWVSNHGGRQLDTTPTTIEVLPEIVDAVDGKVPILIDSGFRLGTDVIKALALGASMVFLGRPIPFGLTVNGEAGVDEVLKLIKEELESAMMFCGTPTIKDITSDIVVHESVYEYCA